mgnify:CR=1 FL=1
MKRSHATIALILFLVASFALFFLIQQTFHFSYDAKSEEFEEFLVSWGPLAPLLYILITALAVVISPIPALPIYFVAAFLWNPFLATVFTVIGNVIGAVIAFLIARMIGKDFISKIFRRDVTICRNCTDAQVAGALLVARFFPIFHFDIISYAAGLTHISLRLFTIVTTIGIIPKIFLVIYMGNSFFVGKYIMSLIALILVILLFLLPYLLDKYNVFGFKRLREKMRTK